MLRAHAATSKHVSTDPLIHCSVTGCDKYYAHISSLYNHLRSYHNIRKTNWTFFSHVAISSQSVF